MKCSCFPKNRLHISSPSMSKLAGTKAQRHRSLILVADMFFHFSDARRQALPAPRLSETEITSQTLSSRGCIGQGHLPGGRLPPRRRLAWSGRLSSGKVGWPRTMVRPQGRHTCRLGRWAELAVVWRSMKEASRNLIFHMLDHGSVSFLARQALLA